MWLYPADKDILSVMHAHTRAIEIRNFALPPAFKGFDDLKFYFEAYLRGKGNGKLDSIHTPQVGNQPTYKRGLLWVHECPRQL